MVKNYILVKRRSFTAVRYAHLPSKHLWGLAGQPPSLREPTKLFHQSQISPKETKKKNLFLPLAHAGSDIQTHHTTLASPKHIGNHTSLLA